MFGVKVVFHTVYFLSSFKQGTYRFPSNPPALPNGRIVLSFFHTQCYHGSQFELGSAKGKHHETLSVLPTAIEPPSKQSVSLPFTVQIVFKISVPSVANDMFHRTCPTAS